MEPTTSQPKPIRESHLSDETAIYQETDNLQDVSKLPSTEVVTLDRQDPFGNESNAPIKYKTMAWCHDRRDHIPLFSPSPLGHEAFLAIANIFFAYAGHVAFFTLFSELKDPKDFPKSLAFLQLIETILYTVSAVVIYAFVGPGIASPALNSAGPLFRKVAYGIAIPTIVIGGVVNAHVAVKFIYVRLCQGTNAMHTKSFFARSLWAFICAVLWLFSWLIAESIPVFNDILGLASSLFASWFSFAIPGIFWLFLNRHCWFRDRKQKTLFGLSTSVIVVAFFVGVLGVYSSIKSIHLNSQANIGGGKFSCANNA